MGQFLWYNVTWKRLDIHSWTHLYVCSFNSPGFNVYGCRTLGASCKEELPDLFHLEFLVEMDGQTFQ